jgi:hypothetical protein
MVVDPTTKNVYYTEEVKGSKSGAVKFIDAKTGNEVNIQNSEVKEITKDEFKAAVGKIVGPTSPRFQAAAADGTLCSGLLAVEGTPASRLPHGL